MPLLPLHEAELVSPRTSELLAARAAASCVLTAASIGIEQVFFHLGHQSEYSAFTPLPYNYKGKVSLMPLLPLQEAELVSPRTSELLAARAAASCGILVLLCGEQIWS
jgi:hypothetical protein